MSIKEKKNGIVSIVPIHGSEIQITDINNNFKTKNVESALKELKEDKTSLLSQLNKVNTDLSENTKDINTLNTNVAQLSNPSLLINDFFQVWQRGTSFTNVSTYATYTADRWRIDVGNGSVASVEKNDSGLKFTMVTNSSFTPLLVQEIEPKKSIEDTPLTFSAEFGTVSGAFKLRIQHYTDGVHNVVDSDVITTSGKYSVTANIPRNASRLYIIIASTLNTTSSSYYIVKNAKLELGSKATPFVPRSYGEELALCQRYYRRNCWKTLRIANMTTSIIRTCEYNFSVPMRVAPVINCLVSQPISSICTADLLTVINNPTTQQIQPIPIVIYNDGMCDFQFAHTLPVKDYILEITDGAYEFDSEIR